MYYNRFREVGEGTSIPPGLYNLDEIKKWGKSRNPVLPDPQGPQPPDGGPQRRRQGWLMVGGASGIIICTSSR